MRTSEDPETKGTGLSADCLAQVFGRRGPGIVARNPHAMGGAKERHEALRSGDNGSQEYSRPGASEEARVHKTCFNELDQRGVKSLCALVLRSLGPIQQDGKTVFTPGEKRIFPSHFAAEDVSGVCMWPCVVIE